MARPNSTARTTEATGTRLTVKYLQQFLAISFPSAVRVCVPVRVRASVCERAYELEVLRQRTE